MRKIKIVPYEKSLEYTNPEISRFWHPTKNGELTPKDVTYGSNKEIWWICEKGHEWQRSIRGMYRYRTRNYCPHCILVSNPKLNKQKKKITNLRVTISLEEKNPELAKQWHPTKNGELKPNDVSYGSNIRVWWICEKGHEWDAMVKTRSRGIGCPFCYKEGLKRKDVIVKVKDKKNNINQKKEKKENVNNDLLRLEKLKESYKRVFKNDETKNN